MKAISIKQPWAEAIISGTKTIEIRTWATHYRGNIEIHTGKKMDDKLPLGKNYDSNFLDNLPLGALIGEAELVEIKLYENKTSFKADINLHLSDPEWYCQEAFTLGNIFGWVFKNPKRLENPIPMKGQLNIFEIKL